MGPQSQRRLTLQERTHQLKAGSNKKRKTGQQTLQGEAAFDPIKNCPVCRARASNLPIPHRAHHKLCVNNRKTKGVTSFTTLNQIRIDKQLKEHFQKPLAQSEKADWRNSTVEAGKVFFAPRGQVKEKEFRQEPAFKPSTSNMTDWISAGEMCKAVSEKVLDASFVAEQSKRKNPIAMAAFAGFVSEKIIRAKKIPQYFKGITLTVPATEDSSMCGSPHYHSIVGMKLLLVDWVRTYALEIKCPTCEKGVLQNDRTNFSKKQTVISNLRP